MTFAHKLHFVLFALYHRLASASLPSCSQEIAIISKMLPSLTQQEGLRARGLLSSVDLLTACPGKCSLVLVHAHAVSSGVV